MFLSVSGSCWDEGIGREGTEDKLVGQIFQLVHLRGASFLLTLPQG